MIDTIDTIDTFANITREGEALKNTHPLYSNTDGRTQMMKFWDLPEPSSIVETDYNLIEKIACSLDNYSTPHAPTTSEKKTKTYDNFMQNLRAYIGYITFNPGMADTTKIDFVVSNTRRFFSGKRITLWVSFAKDQPPLLMHWSSKIGFQRLI
jgi:hypothetical protein